MYVKSDELTLTESQIDLCAREFLNSFRNDMLFQSKANRDAVWRACKKYSRQKLTRRSTGRSLLDPRYTFEGSDLPDKGLGNESQMFGNLYELAKPRSW